MVFSRTHGSSLASVLLLAAFIVSGCAAPSGPAPQVIVPAPAKSPAGQAGKIYSYKHSVRPDHATAEIMDALRDEFVVAVARVGDTTGVASPFGDRRVATAVNEVNISATGTPGETTKVVAGVDDSLRAESIKAEPTPGGFTLRTRGQIISELMNAGCFTVIERENINDILRELEFGKSKMVSKAGAPIDGGLVNVRYIVKGGLEVEARAVLEGVKPPTPDNWVGNSGFPEKSPSASPYLFRLRMYSVESGAVVSSVVGRGEHPRDAIADSVRRLRKQLIRAHRNMAEASPE